MDGDSGRPAKRGLSFPFLLSLLLFGLVLADITFAGPGFLVSAVYRQQPLFGAGIVVTGVLLWLWVLAAAWPRSVRFGGPIDTVRGTNGALQPILATIFLVAAANMAHDQTVPRWLNYIIAQDVVTQHFVIADAPAPERRGCNLAKGSNPDFGEVHLCLPAGLAGSAPGATIAVTGASSYFGLEPSRYALAEDDLIEPRLTVEPAAVIPTAQQIVTDFIVRSSDDKTKAQKN